MEEITEYHREKYENILSEIERIQNEYEELKKESSKINDALRVLKILKNPDFAKEKLFQVRIKLFNNIFELINLYPDCIHLNEFNAISWTNHTLYLTEIFISQLLHEKLINQNWIITISISNTNSKICRSINVKNRVSNPIKIVIPFPETTEVTSVDVYLASPGENFWPILNLSTIEIDLSYKFNSVSQEKYNLSEDVMKINRMYNPDFPKNYESKLLEYKFYCDWSLEKFIEAVLINSCHKLDLTKVFNVSQNAFKFITDTTSHLEFDQKNKVILIRATAKELHHLKKYLMKFSGINSRADFTKEVNFSQLKALGSQVKDEMKYKNVNLHHLLNIYDNYLKNIAHLPL